METIYILKLIYFSETKKIGLHVRFCNDKGRRSWTTSFENYYGKLDLLTKYPNCLVSKVLTYLELYYLLKKSENNCNFFFHSHI